MPFRAREKPASFFYSFVGATMNKWITGRDLIVPAVAAGLLAAVAGVQLKASDHQQTVFTELNPQFDITDVYAFPAQTAGRIAFVISVSSPLTPAQLPFHGFADASEAIYQLKIDNTPETSGSNVREDRVFQIYFTGPKGSQTVTVLGPVAPREVGTVNTLVSTSSVVTGAVNTNLGSATGVQVFAGPRNDPFFIDLEQFFRIIPDRKPVSGPLSRLPSTPTASSFRHAGEAPDFLRGFLALSIVIEVPEALVTGGTPGRFGVWATVNRTSAPTP